MVAAEQQRLAEEEEEVVVADDSEDDLPMSILKGVLLEVLDPHEAGWFVTAVY